MAIPSDAPSPLVPQRGSLGRVVCLIANERLVHIVFCPAEKLYYISPILSNSLPSERFLISGTRPFRSQGLDTDKWLSPDLMTEQDITIGKWCFQQRKETLTGWESVNNHVTADFLIHVLCQWTGWDTRLTAILEERVRCSSRYLMDAYANNRPCPTGHSDFITWEQSIVEANVNPLHKCRLPVDPKTQPVRGYNFQRILIRFMAIDRGLVEINGLLEQEIAPLLREAGIDRDRDSNAAEVILPVHDFQVKYILSKPEAKGKIRLLSHTVEALAQASTRTVTVPTLRGLAFKLSLSMVIGNSLRVIDRGAAFSAVRYWIADMMDPRRVKGFRDTPLEILPEVASANALGDHLAVMVRYDPYHPSRAPVDPDVCYAVTGAMIEPAVLGQQRSVAESVFMLETMQKRLDFLREYTQQYFRCFLPPLFYNGCLINAHGQNSIVRFSRDTGRILGFSSRDMSSTRFNKACFERTTGMQVHPRMENHHLSVSELLELAYFTFFVVHLCPLIFALDLDPRAPASFTSTDLMNGKADLKELGDLSRGNGCAVIVRELHSFLQEYEGMGGDSLCNKTARELSKEARRLWLEERTWPLKCFVSQRMRADWSHREKNDRASFIPAPNILVTQA